MCVRVSSKDLLYLYYVGSNLNEIQESYIDTNCFSCFKLKQKHKKLIQHQAVNVYKVFLATGNF